MRFKLLIPLFFMVVLSGVRCTRNPEQKPVVTKGVSIESSCFNQNKSFIGHYFSGQVQHASTLDRFFDCMDNLIQALLNHTQTEDPEYYTQVELGRFILYMGGAKTAKTEEEAQAKAKEMSQALLNLKAGFIGGQTDRLTLEEITLCRQILSILRTKMRELLPSVPSIIQALRGKLVSKSSLSKTTQVLKESLKSLSTDLSSLSFSANLSLLQKAPQNIQILTGLSHQTLKYWQPSVLILEQWQKMFSSSGQVIKSEALPALLNSFGEFSALWFYHSRFLKGKFYLDYAVVLDTQYVLSRALDVIEKALESSHHKQIALMDLDELASRIWFLPALSKPAFRLGLRSVSCFLLKPLLESKVCEHSTHFEEKRVIARFLDVVFTITDKKEIQESRTNTKGGHITLAELKVLHQYLDSWSQAEQKIRDTAKGGHGGQNISPSASDRGSAPQQEEMLPSLFGSPHKWVERKIDVTAQGGLVFHGEKGDNGPLLSRLNWQSHLMKLSATAYTNRGQGPIDQKLWNVMIEEWTALAVAVYPPLEWELFQKAGSQMFFHGDFMTSQSNGDRILQAEELLELFSLSVSSTDLLLSTLELTKHCEGDAPYSLPMDCLFDTLQAWPASLFSGFPMLTQKFLAQEGAKNQYMNTLKSFYSEEGMISHKDLFKMFLIIHYQENMMEYLDTDGSLDLSTQELTALMPVFEKTIIEDIPLFNNKREAFAFITYLFYYGELPIWGETEEISTPLHFSNWLLRPEKWRVKADQLDLLKVIFLVSGVGSFLN